MVLNSDRGAPVERAADFRLQLVLAVALDHLEHRAAAVDLGGPSRDPRDPLRLELVAEEVADRRDGRDLRLPARRNAAFAPLPDSLPADPEEPSQLGFAELE